MTTFSSLGSFTPSGDLWTRLNLNFTRLEEAKYYPENVYQRENQAKKWPGDTEGRTLLAWILLEQACGRPARYLEAMLERWPEEVNEAGYFGHLYTDGISEQQLSSHGWVLQALAELERLRPGGPARELAEPILANLFLPTEGAYVNYPSSPSDREQSGEYSGSHLEQVGAWILSTDVGCFAIGMTGLIDATIAFGLKDRTAPLIEEMLSGFLAIDLEAIQAQTHATLTACRGMVLWAQATKNESLYAAARERYELYRQAAWTETYANYNWFGRPQWTEPCAMVDSLMVAMELWRFFDEAEFLHDAHRIWFNALGHGQRSNGGFGCDNCPGADGETELFFKTKESHWCCTMRGGEGLSRMTQYQVARDPDGVLFLPFGLPGDFADGNQALSVRSGYPYSADWVFCNRGKVPLSLKLFVPDWIDGMGASGDGWLAFGLQPQEERILSGNLRQTERPLLEATTHFLDEPATGPHGKLKVRLRGPLILGRYGDDWKPIADDYLRNDMSRDSSRKTLLAE